MSKIERIYSPKNMRREEAPLLSDTITLCQNNKRRGIFVQQDYRLFLYNNQEYPLKYVKPKGSVTPHCPRGPAAPLTVDFKIYTQANYKLARVKENTGHRTVY